jgi:hypothetical protein
MRLSLQLIQARWAGVLEPPVRRIPPERNVYAPVHPSSYSKVDVERD